ncbi:hypothetical protein LEP3755_28580 [Leptolyngbya sp. NIES-3755]|nr:hypothetical protein LEP3755_28580 [Leptolyngbya sp. NIES-3755]
MKIVAFTRLVTFALLTMIAIVACQGDVRHLSIESSSPLPNRSHCRTVKHESGETSVCGQPNRIVALEPYALEPLLALGIQPVGFADHIAFHRGDYANPSQQIPYLGKQMTRSLVNLGLDSSPSIEMILKLKPDLIVGLHQNNAAQYATFSKIAPTVLINYGETEANLKTIAKAVDRSKQAEQVLAETQHSIAIARETFAPLATTHSKVLLLSASELHEMSLESPMDACGSLIKTLGFQLMALSEAANSNASKFLSLEALPDLNAANLIIVLGSNFSDQLKGEDFATHQLFKLKQAWKTNAIAQSLDASKSGRVYFIPVYLCRGLPGTIGTQLYLNELQKQLLSDYGSSYD